jgi:hypothetical protein
MAGIMSTSYDHKTKVFEIRTTGCGCCSVEYLSHWVKQEWDPDDAEDDDPRPRIKDNLERIEGLIRENIGHLKIAAEAIGKDLNDFL